VNDKFALRFYYNFLCCNFLYQADYSLGFDSTKEREIFFTTRNEVGERKARAIADFEQEDEHDLGFHRDNIIQIVSTEDEHRWIGELNGRYF